MAEPLLVFDDVGFEYGDGFGLCGINLCIEPGDRLAVVGANGSGKSTLAKVISGLLQPSSGTVSGTCRAPRDVGTAIDLRLGSQGRTIADVVDAELTNGNVNNVLASVALSRELATRRIKDLSGGERYRVAVGIQLANRPPLLVLDAPTAALDAISTAGLVGALDRRRSALIVLSADLTLAVEVCQRVVLLDKGRIVASGTPAELLTDTELLRWHGLRLPAAISPSP